MTSMMSARGERPVSRPQISGVGGFPGVGGELAYESTVAPGVTITWDPGAPRRSVAFQVEGRSPQITSVRTALTDAASTDDHHPQPITVIQARGRWLRLAAVGTVDDLLHLQLNRSLLDAEIAATQLAVARTLRPGGAIHRHLVRCALIAARRGSRGVTEYMKRLVVDNRRPPLALEASLETLAGCYAALAEEVSEPDARLIAVVEAWRRLSAIGGADCLVPEPALEARAAVHPLPGGIELVDPRQVPARVLARGSSTDSAEIEVVPVRWESLPAVRVRVAAFDNGPFPDDTVDLRVRLVDRRSGEPCGDGLLGGLVTRPARSLGRAGDRYFEGVVLLPDAVAARDVRVEIYVSGADRTPGPAGREELMCARRAVQFLSEWRELVADVRLRGYAAAPATRLREITQRLTSDSGGSRAVRNRPLWAGAPTATSGDSPASVTGS